MRRFGLASIALSSALLVSVAVAAARPHYGGMLRIAVKGAPMSLDPLQQFDSLPENNLTRLIFDTLMVVNDQGMVLPSLATSWRAESGNQRWQITIRQGVTFADGSPLSPDAVASSLRAANPAWKIFPGIDSVIVETEAPTPDLPARLALPRNAIVKRSSAIVGTGPFVVNNWQPGRSLGLTARENYWNGRPFLDSVQISLGENLKEQMLSLELGKFDAIEIAADQARHADTGRHHVITSQPGELVALLFSRDPEGVDEELTRQVLALSIDRDSINNVLLQGAGVPAGSLLPNWMSGYSFLFPTQSKLDQAQQLRAQIRHAPTWTLGYDVNDPVGRVIADRIALNARDAGIGLRVASGSNPDVRLVRVRLEAVNSELALNLIARRLKLTPPASALNSAEDLFTAETSMLRSSKVIPLLHTRTAYVLAPSVRNWTQDPEGGWHLENVWMGADTE